MCSVRHSVALEDGRKAGLENIKKILGLENITRKNIFTGSVQLARLHLIICLILMRHMTCCRLVSPEVK